MQEIQKILFSTKEKSAFLKINDFFIPEASAEAIIGGVIFTAVAAASVFVGLYLGDQAGACRGSERSSKTKCYFRSNAAVIKSLYGKKGFRSFSCSADGQVTKLNVNEGAVSLNFRPVTYNFLWSKQQLVEATKEEGDQRPCRTQFEDGVVTKNTCFIGLTTNSAYLFDQPLQRLNACCKDKKCVAELNAFGASTKINNDDFTPAEASEAGSGATAR